MHWAFGIGEKMIGIPYYSCELLFMVCGYRDWLSIIWLKYSTQYRNGWVRCSAENLHAWSFWLNWIIFKEGSFSSKAFRRRQSFWIKIWSFWSFWSCKNVFILPKIIEWWRSSKPNKILLWNMFRIPAKRGSYELQVVIGWKLNTSIRFSERNFNHRALLNRWETIHMIRWIYANAEGVLSLNSSISISEQGTLCKWKSLSSSVQIAIRRRRKTRKKTDQNPKMLRSSKQQLK